MARQVVVAVLLALILPIEMVTAQEPLEQLRVDLNVLISNKMATVETRIKDLETAKEEFSTKLDNLEKNGTTNLVGDKQDLQQSHDGGAGDTDCVDTMIDGNPCEDQWGYICADYYRDYGDGMCIWDHIDLCGENFGTACCACGGGVQSGGPPGDDGGAGDTDCVSTVGWVYYYYNTCENLWSGSLLTECGSALLGSDGTTVSQACCECGGGVTTYAHPCNTEQLQTCWGRDFCWHDPTGDFGCENYCATSSEECLALPDPAGAAANGDPHLKNIKGESFDVMQTGNMLLLEVPRGSRVETLEFAVHGDIERLGLVECGPTFITKVVMAGRWLETPVSIRAGKSTYKPFGIQFKGAWKAHADFEKTTNGRMSVMKRDRAFLMKVDVLDIAVSMPNRPRAFLDLQIKGIGKITAQVGGLLGLDDHTAAETLPSECNSPKRRRLSVLRAEVGEEWSATAAL